MTQAGVFKIAPGVVVTLGRHVENNLMVSESEQFLIFTQCFFPLDDRISLKVQWNSPLPAWSSGFILCSRLAWRGPA